MIKMTLCILKKSHTLVTGSVWRWTDEISITDRLYNLQHPWKDRCTVHGKRMGLCADISLNVSPIFRIIILLSSLITESVKLWCNIPAVLCAMHWYSPELPYVVKGMTKSSLVINIFVPLLITLPPYFQVIVGRGKPLT